MLRARQNCHLCLPCKFICIVDRIHRRPWGKAISKAVQFLSFPSTRYTTLNLLSFPRCDYHGVNIFYRTFQSRVRIFYCYILSIIRCHDRIRSEFHSRGIEFLIHVREIDEINLHAHEWILREYFYVFRPFELKYSATSVAFLKVSSPTITTRFPTLFEFFRTSMQSMTFFLSAPSKDWVRGLDPVAMTMASGCQPGQMPRQFPFPA